MIGRKPGLMGTTPTGGKARAPCLWLVTGREGPRRDALVVDLPDGGEALAVFSFEEEAEMFLRFATRRAGRRVRATTAGELVSLLSAPYARVRCVALDPLPGAGMRQPALLCLTRKGFVRALVRGGFGRNARSADRSREAGGTAAGSP